MCEETLTIAFILINLLFANTFYLLFYSEQT